MNASNVTLRQMTSHFQTALALQSALTLDSSAQSENGAYECKMRRAH